MLRVPSWSRRASVAMACTTAALVLSAAASQASVVTTACPVPAATTQFAGDFHYYYDGGGADLSAGSPASVAACVNVPHPTVRLSIANGTPGSTISATAVFQTDAGAVAFPLGSVPADAGLSRRLHVPDITRRGIAASGGSVAFTLVLSVDSGSATVSHAWIDPWGG